MSTFAILSSYGNFRLHSSVKTLEGVGGIILIKAMRAEGFTAFNTDARLEYLTSWAEFMNENEESEDNTPIGVIDHVADHLVSSNMHIIRLSNSTQISDEERDVVRKAIEYKLNDSFK